MATTVDTLLVRIEADMSDLKRSLKKVEQDVDKSSRGIGNSFKKIGAAMKGAVAAIVVQQAFRAGAALVNLASDIEEMQGKSKVVFGKFRDTVVADLEEFGNAVGRSTFELEGMAASIQDTFVPMGFARGEASKLSVELTKLAVDVASFNNASDTETMAAFQSALVGNHETVRRFGVIITESTLSQELMRMGIEKGTKAATEAQKVQARLNLIMAGTTDAHGDAERTSDSYANSMRGLKAELSELGGEIGTIVLPAMVKLIAIFRQAATGLREFLQVVGILEKSSEVLSLNGFEEGIQKSSNKVDELTKKVEEAGKSASYPATPGELPLTVQLENARSELNELRAEYLSFSAQEFNKGPSGPKTPAGTSNDNTDDPDEKKQYEAFVALNAEMRINEQLEANLRKARESGDKIAIKVALAQIEKQKLNKKFNLVNNDLIRTTALQIAENILAEEARAKAVKDAADAKAEADRIEQEFNASVEKGIGFVRQNIDLAYQYEQIQADLNKAKQAGKITEDEYAQALAITKQQILELDPLYKQLTDSANQAFDKMADSLTEMVMSGKFDLKSLGDMFKQTVREMIADAVKAQIIKPILGSIFGAIGGSIGGTFGSFISGIGTKAGGGSVNSGVPQIVGERGPELIVPKSASTIMNNHNTKNELGSGGGTIVQQTINVSAGVSQTVRAEMLSLLPRFKQDTMAAVVDAKRRGGTYGSAFG